MMFRCRSVAGRIWGNDGQMIQLSSVMAFLPRKSLLSEFLPLDLPPGKKDRLYGWAGCCLLTCAITRVPVLLTRQRTDEFPNSTCGSNIAEK